MRLYGYLFDDEDPESEETVDFMEKLNMDSLQRLFCCKLEPELANAEPGSRYQFLRHGYFCVDTVCSKPGNLVFNRIVSLKDTWAKLMKTREGKSK